MLTCYSQLALSGADFYVCSPLAANLNFFPTTQLAVGFLKFFEDVQPVGIRLEGENYWEYYFEPIAFGTTSNDLTTHLTNGQKQALLHEAVHFISREEAHRLFKKYIRVRPFVQNRIDMFKSKYFTNHYVIGVYYGQDELSLAPLPSFDVVCKQITKIVEQLPDNNYKIFLATSDRRLLNYLRSKFKNKVISHNALRIYANKSMNSVNLLNGADAVMQSFLLAECNIFLRQTSYLGLMVESLNLQLPVVDLGAGC